MKFLIFHTFFILISFYSLSKNNNTNINGTQYNLTFLEENSSLLANKNYLELNTKIDICNKKLDTIVANDEKYYKPFLDFLPFFIAILTAFFALLQVRLNIIKSSKVKWLDKFNELLSDYVTELELINVLYQNMIDNNTEISEDFRIAMKNSSLIEKKIRLHLKKDFGENPIIIEKIKNLETIIHSLKQLNNDEMNVYIDEIIKEGINISNNVWSDIKHVGIFK